MSNEGTLHDEFVPDTDVRKRAPWTRVLLLSVIAFLIWFLLFAPTIQHNAEVSPVGTRRTIGLDVVGPVAALSRDLDLSRIVSETDDATGRTGNRPGNGAAVVVEGPRVHHHHRPPPGPPTYGPSTTTTAPPDVTHPTASHPLRVLIVGDSIGLDLGGPLQNDLANTGVVQVTLDGVVDTGLTRPDYFNWPVRLQSDLRMAQPQVVVVMMGANDPQDFPGPPDVPFSSARWNPLYAARVATFMQIAEGGGATVIWVGMPPMQNAGLSAKMSDVDAVDQQQAVLQTPPVDFISSWTLLGTAQGTYTPFITNASGQILNVRTTDGTHLTPAGGEVLSQTVINYLKGTLHYVLP